MKVSLLTPLILSFFSADAQNVNDHIRTNNPPKTGWFGRRRGASLSSDELTHREVLKASSTAMHSFTGAEGIDHTSVVTPVEKEGLEEEKPEPLHIEGAFLELHITVKKCILTHPNSQTNL